MKDMTNEEMIVNWNKAQRAGAVLPCPRCGHMRMRDELAANSLSRRANVYICASCGNEEAFEDIPYQRGTPLSVSSWWLFKTLLGKQDTTPDSKGNFNLRVTRDLRLTQENIDDIMTTALEGGINYWCSAVEIVEEEIVDGEPRKKYFGEYVSDQISRGGSLRLYDVEENETHLLTREKFINGFFLACQNGWAEGSDWYDDDGGVDCCNIDANGADVIIQYALFGEVLYG